MKSAHEHQAGVSSERRTLTGLPGRRGGGQEDCEGLSGKAKKWEGESNDYLKMLNKRVQGPTSVLEKSLWRPCIPSFPFRVSAQDLLCVQRGPGTQQSSWNAGQLRGEQNKRLENQSLLSWGEGIMTSARAVAMGTDRGQSSQEGRSCRPRYLTRWAGAGCEHLQGSLTHSTWRPRACFLPSAQVLPSREQFQNPWSRLSPGSG